MSETDQECCGGHGHTHSHAESSAAQPAAMASAHLCGADAPCFGNHAMCGGGASAGCIAHAEAMAAAGTQAAGGPASQPAVTCADHVEGEACCGGGHGHGNLDDYFAMPTTTEMVSLPAIQLAGLIDLVEKLAAEPSVLTGEADYLEAQKVLEAQAPQLVHLREEFLERMRSLMAEAGVAL